MKKAKFMSRAEQFHKDSTIDVDVAAKRIEFPEHYPFCGRSKPRKKKQPEYFLCNSMTLNRNQSREHLILKLLIELSFESFDIGHVSEMRLCDTRPGKGCSSGIVSRKNGVPDL